MSPLGEEGLTLEGMGLLSAEEFLTCLQAGEGSKVGDIAQNYRKCFQNVLSLLFLLFWSEREATDFLVPFLA